MSQRKLLSTGTLSGGRGCRRANVSEQRMRVRVDFYSFPDLGVKIIKCVTSPSPAWGRCFGRPKTDLLLNKNRPL